MSDDTEIDVELQKRTLAVPLQDRSVTVEKQDRTASKGEYND